MSEGVNKDLCDQRYGELKGRVEELEEIKKEMPLLHQEILNAKIELRQGMISILAKGILILGSVCIALVIILFVAIITGKVKIP